MAADNFKDSQHALRTGLLIGALRAAGFDAVMTTDHDGDWTPVIRIVGSEQFDVELLAEK